MIAIAKHYGWLVYHPLPAMNARGKWRTAQAGDTGFPDLVLAHHRRGVIFAELKSEIGRVSDRQMRWISELRQAGAEAYVWRPSALPLIEQMRNNRKRDK